VHAFGMRFHDFLDATLLTQALVLLASHQVIEGLPDVGTHMAFLTIVRFIPLIRQTRRRLLVTRSLCTDPEGFLAIAHACQSPES
jgi:hypothetical protein